jgi:hypothetical protein
MSLVIRLDDHFDPKLDIWQAIQFTRMMTLVFPQYQAVDTHTRYSLMSSFTSVILEHRMCTGYCKYCEILSDAMKTLVTSATAYESGFVKYVAFHVGNTCKGHDSATELNILSKLLREKMPILSPHRAPDRPRPSHILTNVKSITNTHIPPDPKRARESADSFEESCESPNKKFKPVIPGVVSSFTLQRGPPGTGTETVINI